MVREKMMEDSISSEPEKYLDEKGLRLFGLFYLIHSPQDFDNGKKPSKNRKQKRQGRG